MPRKPEPFPSGAKADLVGRSFFLRKTSPSSTSRATSLCTLHLCNSHHSTANRYTRVARAASSERRPFYHEELLTSRLIACHSSQNKASERALCPSPSTAKAGSIATAHRLKHAWLASHHRALSSQQSKSSTISVTDAIKQQVATSLQTVAARNLWCCRNRARARAERDSPPAG
jgi:hypothetical protein